MNDTLNPTDSSLLLWLVAAAVAVLAAHVAQGWVLQAQRAESNVVRQQWRALLLAGLTLGTGICAAMLLATSAQGLMFPIGYKTLPAAGLWLGAMAGCLPIVAWAAATQRGWLLALSGVALAALAGGLDIGWLWAAGFRPGIIWRPTFLAAGFVALIVGLTAASWMAYSGFAKGSSRPALWRLGAALLTGLTLAGGQELLIFAAGLPYQQGSIYQAYVPLNVLSLVAGVLVPLVLTVMTVDLLLRRPSKRRRGSSQEFNPRRRRKRRHRIRTL